MISFYWCQAIQNTNILPARCSNMLLTMLKKLTNVRISVFWVLLMWISFPGYAHPWKQWLLSFQTVKTGVSLVPGQRKPHRNRAVLRALNPERFVTWNNGEVSFPTSLFLCFLCLLGMSLLISMLSTVHYKWWNLNQGWAYNFSFSKRFDPEIFFSPSILFWKFLNIQKTWKRLVNM